MAESAVYINRKSYILSGKANPGDNLANSII